MGTGRVPWCGQWHARTHLLLHLHGICHDMDRLVDLHGDEAGRHDAGYLTHAQQPTLVTHVPELLRS